VQWSNWRKKLAQNLAPILAQVPSLTLAPTVKKSAVETFFDSCFLIDASNRDFAMSTIMDHLTLAVQQARAVSIMAQSLQAISQFAFIVDDDDDKQKRVKLVLQQRCWWNRFVMMNQDLPLFCCHLRMTYDSFLMLLEKSEHTFLSQTKNGGFEGRCNHSRTTVVCYSTIPSRWIIFGHLFLLWYCEDLILQSFVGHTNTYMQSTKPSPLPFRHHLRSVPSLLRRLRR
jgi:hypothetical protein